MKQKKFCQSCGMPLDKDPEGGGTNLDQSINPNYCSYCYLNGKFTFEGTVDEFQEFCMQQMRANGQSKFVSWLFTRGLKRLDRWK